LPELFGTREERAFESISQPVAQEQLSAALGGPVGPLLDAARLMVKMRRSRAVHLERLREALKLAPREPLTGLLYVPYLFLRSYGLRSTRQIAAALAAELES
jgi:hypothetical protein